jgi:hypothetical protein
MLLADVSSIITNVVKVLSSVQGVVGNEGKLEPNL